MKALQNRLTYIDLLKIVAAFSVVLAHIACLDWDTLPVVSQQWQVTNFYNSLLRYSVPVFVMCSGVFFLNPQKDITYKKLFSKYILRIVTAFVFWSALYAVFDLMLFDRLSLRAFLIRFIKGEYHLWFLYMIVGLYLIVPFLRKITENKTLSMYYLVLCLVFAILIPQFQRFPIVSAVSKNMSLSFFTVYSFYFIAGYYLNTYTISKKLEIVIYILGIAGAVFTIIGSNLLSLQHHSPRGLHGFVTPNVMLLAVAVFVFFTKRVSRIRFSARSIRVITLLSKCSFGVYLVHVFFIALLQKLGLTPLSFNPMFSLPVIAIIVFILSLCASIFMQKIPVLNKYIV